MTYFVQVHQAVLKLSSISTTAHRSKNSLTPAHHLPPEILILIQTFRESEQDLINATAVCAYWRRSLVSAPTLWNNILCSENASLESITPRLHEYFERSGSVPVNVQISAHSSRLISPHTKRISRLTMFVDATDLDEITEHLSKLAPLLEAASILVKNNQMSSFELPSWFFETFLSTVRNLTVCGTLPYPGLCSFSRLTRFTLRTCVNEDACAILLGTLNQMPLLQVFEAQLLRADPVISYPENLVITLPYLEEITITMDDCWYPDATSPILPALCLPHVRKIVMRSINAFGPHISPILPLSFKEHLPGFNVIPNASISLDKDVNTFHFTSSSQAKLTLCFHRPTGDIFAPSKFGGISFNSVRKLHISFLGTNLGRSYFTGLLLCMRGLEHLEMEQNTVRSLAYWAIDAEQPKTCPALMALTVIDNDFATAKKWAEVVKQVRRRAGVPIASVEVRCN